MKHPHEIETGRTSAVNTEIIGYKDKKQVLFPNNNHSNNSNNGKVHQRWQYVMSRSDRTLTLIE